MAEESLTLGEEDVLVVVASLMECWMSFIMASTAALISDADKIWQHLKEEAAKRLSNVLVQQTF